MPLIPSLFRVFHRTRLMKKANPVVRTVLDRLLDLPSAGDRPQVLQAQASMDLRVKMMVGLFQAPLQVFPARLQVILKTMKNLTLKLIASMPTSLPLLEAMCWMVLMMREVQMKEGLMLANEYLNSLLS